MSINNGNGHAGQWSDYGYPDKLVLNEVGLVFSGMRHAVDQRLMLNDWETFQPFGTSFSSGDIALLVSDVYKELTRGQFIDVAYFLKHKKIRYLTYDLIFEILDEEPLLPKHYILGTNIKSLFPRFSARLFSQMYRIVNLCTMYSLRDLYVKKYCSGNGESEAGYAAALSSANLFKRDEWHMAFGHGRLADKYEFHDPDGIEPSAYTINVAQHADIIIYKKKVNSAYYEIAPFPFKSTVYLEIIPPGEDNWGESTHPNVFNDMGTPFKNAGWFNYSVHEGFLSIIPCGNNIPVLPTPSDFSVYPGVHGYKINEAIIDLGMRSGSSSILFDKPEE